MELIRGWREQQLYRILFYNAVNMFNVHYKIAARRESGETRTGVGRGVGEESLDIPQSSWTAKPTSGATSKYNGRERLRTLCLCVARNFGSTSDTAPLLTDPTPSVGAWKFLLALCSSTSE